MTPPAFFATENGRVRAEYDGLVYKLVDGKVISVSVYLADSPRPAGFEPIEAGPELDRALRSVQTARRDVVERLEKALRQLV